MKDELVEKQKVLERITERQIALQTERAAPRRVIWHEPARVPEAPVEVVPYRSMALAGLLALCLPLALAVGWEGMARRIGGSEDLEQQLHLAVLGEIARLPARSRAVSRSAEARIGEELRAFQESIDSLRTALTLSDDLHDMRILAITSAANHEGKTSLASQLALSLARATGKMTLLIDGDMRSPDVHKVFDVPAGARSGRSAQPRMPAGGRHRHDARRARAFVAGGRAQGEPPSAAGERGLEIAPGADSRQLRLRDHRHAARAGRQRGPGAGQVRRRHPVVRDARREPRGPGAEGRRAIVDRGRASHRYRTQRGTDETPPSQLRNHLIPCRSFLAPSEPCFEALRKRIVLVR